jgi:hypothetical protein
MEGNQRRNLAFGFGETVKKIRCEKNGKNRNLHEFRNLCNARGKKIQQYVNEHVEIMDLGHEKNTIKASTTN